MCAAHNLVRGEERITQVGRNEDLDEEEKKGGTEDVDVDNGK